MKESGMLSLTLLDAHSLLNADTWPINLEIQSLKDLNQDLQALESHNGIS
jgi:hypothetical protein